MRSAVNHTAVRPLAVLSLAVLTLSGCAGADVHAGETDATLTVFAAASLGAPFEELAETFEAEYPGAEVEYNVAGSSTLVEQITAGAPADVFASADGHTMDRAVAASEVSGDPTAFATNMLTLITPAGNPSDLSSLQDLEHSDAKLVVCAPQVPCGAATATLAEDAGVELTPVSEEAQVTDVLGKVTSGEADAGLVYVTDAAGAGDAVDTITLEHAAAAVNTYPIAVLRGAGDHSPEQAELARSFVDHVLSGHGQSVLEDHGFGPPK
ncbi:molybdate ABC transporter substrate-binding protein [Microbacterium sp. A93]|uniref:molybdate ABC transporter substrate-binding protein n=1 Tax=Microbacterium sp. A93 TaxID=3450716 RepID=UPI003F43F162